VEYIKKFNESNFTSVEVDEFDNSLYKIESYFIKEGYIKYMDISYKNKFKEIYGINTDDLEDYLTEITDECDVSLYWQGNYITFIIRAFNPEKFNFKKTCDIIRSLEKRLGNVWVCIFIENEDGCKIEMKLVKK